MKRGRISHTAPAYRAQVSPAKRWLAKLLKKVDFSSVRYLFYGAAPMSVDKLKEAITFFGPIMMGGYGQTEAPAGISALRPEEHFKSGIGGQLADDKRLQSVGRPAPFIKVEIMDGDNNILKKGETGEICVKGDLLMKGYYNDPEQTAKTIIDGWLHTGDVGHIDCVATVHVTGVIIIGRWPSGKEVADDEGQIRNRDLTVSVGVTGNVPDENKGTAGSEVEAARERSGHLEGLDSCFISPSIA